MNIKRTLKVLLVVICNPHRVIAAVTLCTLSGFEWLLEKMIEASIDFRRWIESKSETTPIFAKSISNSLIKESDELQNKKHKEFIDRWSK